MSAAVARLDAIIEALELAGDSTSSYFDVETGEVYSLTEEEFSLAENPETADEDLPDWQREPVELARRIRQTEGKRYLRLPGKFEIHEWEIMDRFPETLADEQLKKDLHASIRGSGAFRRFKNLLEEYKLWDSWNQFKQAELRQIAIEWCQDQCVSYR